MARPRVFVSSTFFDFRQVREDLRRFIESLGYEPVMFEHGEVPYNDEEPLEEDCLREIGMCDIVVGILGSRSGSASYEATKTIVERELEHARESHKVRYYFVEQGIFNEHKVWLRNKDVKEFKLHYADSPKVHELLHEIKSQRGGNPIFPFETVDGMLLMLKAQLAGTFHRLLQARGEQRRAQELKQLFSLSERLSTAIDIFEKRSELDSATLQKVQLLSHPAHSRLKQVLGTQYTPIFFSLEEMGQFCEARTYKRINSASEDNITYQHEKKSGLMFHVDKIIFDDENKLKIFTSNQWRDSWIDDEYDPFADS